MAGGRGPLRGRVGGLEVLGAVGSLSRQPGLLAGPGLASRSRPLAPSPSSRWPETPALRTKTSWARQVLLGVSGKGLQESLGPPGTGLARLAKGAMEN